jgi:hypothetical protein
MGDHNNYLSEKEIDELKNIFKEKCKKSIINDYSRKIYNLFVNNILFEPDNDINKINDDLYYLGVYYQYININYDLAKKYLLMAVDKGCIAAMNNLGNHYQFIEKNYNLANKYFLMAFDKGGIIPIEVPNTYAILYVLISLLFCLICLSYILF